LTARSWSVRVLGTARHVELLNRATWVVTGNNVSVRGDLARRCYRIRLDPSMEKPWQRNSWKHPDLLSYAKQKRCEIVAALLTLIKYWANNGAKMFTERVLGSFDRWCKIAGGILAAAQMKQQSGRTFSRRGTGYIQNQKTRAKPLQQTNYARF